MTTYQALISSCLLSAIDAKVACLNARCQAIKLLNLKATNEFTIDVRTLVRVHVLKILIDQGRSGSNRFRVGFYGTGLLVGIVPRAH